jgi:hypothetical protein
MGASKICLSSIVDLPVKLNGNGRRHRYRSPRRHFRNQQRAAVLRAVTAAKIYLDGTLPTLAAAAIACGSNVHYVGAAVTLLKSENGVLLGRVLRGAMPLLAAAREAKRVASLVSAYREASADDLVVFTRVIGPANLWDNAIVPVI